MTDVRGSKGDLSLRKSLHTGAVVGGLGWVGVGGFGMSCTECFGWR